MATNTTSRHFRITDGGGERCGAAGVIGQSSFTAQLCKKKKKTGKIRQEMITQGTKSNGSRGLCCAKQETKYTTTPHSITHMKRVKRVRANGIAGGGREIVGAASAF